MDKTTNLTEIAEEENEFHKAKDRYNELREKERKDLADYLQGKLKNEGITVKKKGQAGKGRRNYTSGGRIASYDLSNWKWVELNHAEHEFTCIVSLNMVDTDPKSGNVHCLYDRIGLQITYVRNNHYYKTNIYTDIDLPLCEDAKEKILKLILAHVQLANETCI